METQAELIKHPRAYPLMVSRVVNPPSETMTAKNLQDVVIVGGGPAGMSAARLLGGGLRKVTLIENEWAGGQDPPQLGPLETVSRFQTEVEDVGRNSLGFLVHCQDGTVLLTRTLLLAGDFGSHLPAITGAAEYWGRALHQCPYCDAWEHRDREIGVLGADEDAVSLALKLRQWSPRVTLFTRRGTLDTDCEKRLKKRRIRVVEQNVVALEGRKKKLERLRLEDASFQGCEALFFSAPRKYHSSLAARLGCDWERIPGAVRWQRDRDDGIKGLFVVENTQPRGEAGVTPEGEGLKAGELINEWLTAADLASFVPPEFTRGKRTFGRRSLQRGIRL